MRIRLSMKRSPPPPPCEVELGRPRASPTTSARSRHAASKAAARIAEHVREAGIAPELVLCSSALRTRQTLAALLPALAGDVEIRLEDALYGAGVDEVLARVREVHDDVSAPSS